MKTILYFGLFDPNLSRNKTYAAGLRQNCYNVIYCEDHSPGLLKFWRLFRKHGAVRNDYDVMIVGYTGYITVPLAKLISRKRVIFDAGWSLYETKILSRDEPSNNPFKVPYVRFIDWLATRCADFVLVETEHQKQYFINSIGVRPEKLVVVYTGVDDALFYPDENVKKFDRFTVLFRGRITREAGAVHVLRAAKLLEEEGIDFLIIGFGWGEPMEEFDRVMEELKPKNVRHIRTQLPLEELRTLMLRCHVSLGQLADHERLERTIPHKCYESMAMKLPYITARAAGVCEILKEGKHCLMCNPGDAEDLAQAVRLLHNNQEKAQQFAQESYLLFQDKFRPGKVVEPILHLT